MMRIVNLKSNHLRRSEMTQVVASKEQETLSQVWVQLSEEHQTGVIHLMAQLVLKLVVAQIESNWKEPRDEQNQG